LSENEYERTGYPLAAQEIMNLNAKLPGLVQSPGEQVRQYEIGSEREKEETWTKKNFIRNWNVCMPSFSK
jgi:hypothetical protein